MTISMQTNLSAGYMPSGAESKPLDPTSQKVVEKAGVLPESASNYVGAEINGTQSGHHTALLKTLLPEPGNDRPVGDPLGELTEAEVAVDIYSVMMLFQQCAQQMRNQAREVRNSEMQSQVAQLKGAAKEIRKAAQERLTQAMIQGWLQIGGGSLSAGMGAVGALGGMTSLKLGPKTFWGGWQRLPAVVCPAWLSLLERSRPVLGAWPGLGTKGPRRAMMPGKRNGKRKLECMSRICSRRTTQCSR